MIRGVVIRLTTEELLAAMHAKADWYEKQSKTKPEGEREKWAYDAKFMRYVAARLPADETFELSFEEMRMWVHFAPGLYIVEKMVS